MRPLATAALLLAMATPAAAQGSISFDSALATGDKRTPHPGITFTAPLLGGDAFTVSLLARIRQADDATHTTAGARLAPTGTLWRFRPYLDIGLSALNGSIALEDVLALEITRGIKFYVRPDWGLGLAWPSTHFAGPEPAGERLVVSLFGEW